MNLSLNALPQSPSSVYTRPASAAATTNGSPALQDVADSFQFSAPAAESKETAAAGKLNPRELGEKQFADSYGRVTNLALMLSPYAGGLARRQMLDAYKTLFTRMEPDTKFTITVQTDGDRRDIEKAMKDCNCPNPERVSFIKPDVGGLTVWARDMMVPLQLTQDKDHVALLGQQPLHDWHDNDKQVPIKICNANPKILLDDDKTLVTDGGDVLANTKESFVGYYSLSATAQKLSKSVEGDRGLEHNFVAAYERATGNHVVDEGSPVQFSMVPVARTDAQPGGMTWELAPNPEFRQPQLGDHEVTKAQMYEDTAQQMFSKKFGNPVTVLGKDNPATSHHEEPATDHMDMGCTPIDDKTFLVGDPGLANKILAGMSPAEIADAEKKLSEINGRPISLTVRNRDNQEDFDAYEKTLKDKGYDVARVPHLEPGGAGRSYISYNNCLMERFTRQDGTDVRRVFLPVYDIPKLDNAAKKVWNSQGFEVIPMPLSGLSERWGALRCVSNWLERSPQG